MSTSLYCINSSYTHRRHTVENYLDDADASSQYQLEVYAYARDIYKGGHVLDIGCGVGDKLCKNFPVESTLGLDLEPTLTNVRQRYPERKWALSNFSAPPPGHFSLVISADVIEHIFDPDEYIDFVCKLDFDVFVISTPDRDTLAKGRLGPPQNPSHYREWNFPEFYEYINKRLNVLEHRHCQEPGYLSQLIAFTK